MTQRRYELKGEQTVRERLNQVALDRDLRPSTRIAYQRAMLQLRLDLDGSASRATLGAYMVGALEVPAFAGVARASEDMMTPRPMRAHAMFSFRRCVRYASCGRCAGPQVGRS